MVLVGCSVHALDAGRDNTLLRATALVLKRMP
jgi:hypothetical protein